jgi:hypothetical protein
MKDEYKNHPKNPANQPFIPQEKTYSEKGKTNVPQQQSNKGKKR